MSLSIGVLSWRCHETLRNALTSYRELGLLDYADERLLYFQEISERDRALALEFGFQALGGPDNIGCGPGMRKLAEAATSECVLLLENDWELVEDLRHDTRLLDRARELLSAGEVDAVRLRHRDRPGVPFWAGTHVRGHEREFPTHLLWAVCWIEDPAAAFPEAISRLGEEPTLYAAAACHADFSFNPCLYRRSWIVDVLERACDYEEHAALRHEAEMQRWWCEQPFVVAQGAGLFMHRELDSPSESGSIACPGSGTPATRELASASSSIASRSPSTTSSSAPDVDATVVTCLLDIGRAEAGREFDFYTRSFERFREIRSPLVVYTQPELAARLRACRAGLPTEIRTLELEQLRGFRHFDAIERIRTSSAWQELAPWVAASPQARLEYYNPLVMMKPYWLRDVSQANPFGTTRFYWLDGGIFSNPIYRYMGQWVAREAIPQRRFLLFSYGFRPKREANGMPIGAFERYCATSPIRWWVRGGLFGGDAREIPEFTGHYDEVLDETLASGHLGTEENVMTILAHRLPERFDRQRLWFNRFSAGVLRRSFWWRA